MGNSLFNLSRRPLVAATLGLLLILGCASEEERFQRYMSNAEEFAAENDLGAALIELKNALKLRPSDPEVNFQIAELARDAGQIDNSLFYYLETYRIDPLRSDAALRAVPLLYHSDTDRAAELIAEVLEREPSSYEAYIQWSELDLVNGDIQAGLQHAFTAVELGPESPRSHRLLGLVYRSQMRLDRLQGKRISPDTLDKALAALGRAKALAPMSWAIELDRAEILSKMPASYTDQTLASFQSAYALSIEAGGDIGRKTVLESAWKRSRPAHRPLDDYRLLEWSLQTLTQDFPEIVEGWQRLSLHELRRGRPARPVFERYLEARPEDLTAYSTYADFLVTVSEPEEAFALVQKGLEVCPDTLGMLSLLFTIAVQADQVPVAKEALARMEEEYPEELKTAVARARWKSRSGRYAEAEAILETATGADEDGIAQALLARVRLRQGNLPQARSAIERSMELGMDSHAIARRVESQILVALGDCKGALRSIRELSHLVVNLEPLDRYRRIYCFYETGRVIAARRSLVQLLDKGNAPPEAVVLFVEREGKPSNREQVEKYVLAAYKRFPASVDLLEIIVKSDLHRGEAELALTRVVHALQQRPKSPELHILNAQLLLANGKPEDARKAALAIFKARPNREGVAETLVYVYQKTDTLEEAIAALQDTADGGELESDGLLLLARLYASQDRFTESIQAFEQTITTGGDSAQIKNDLAFLLARENRDLDRALDLAKAARSESAKNPTIADTLGFVYMKKGLLDAAIQQFEYAIQMAEAEGSPVALYYEHLGQALREDGRSTEAEEALETAKALAEG